MRALLAALLLPRVTVPKPMLAVPSTRSVPSGCSRAISGTGVAVAESETGVDGFRFWDRPLVMPETAEPETNVYDMRLTAHEDGWIYGVFCVERKDPDAPPGDLSSATAQGCTVSSMVSAINCSRVSESLAISL